MGSVHQAKMFKKRPKKESHGVELDEYYYSGIENVSQEDGKELLKKKILYDVYFLGIVPDIVVGKSLSRDKEPQMVDRIEESQIEGKLPISPQENDKVKINVSIHGIKVIDIKGQEVLQRHPLHTIAQVIQYSDGGGMNNIAFIIGNVNKPVFSAYVFQCMSEDQAQTICESLQAEFDELRTTLVAYNTD